MNENQFTPETGNLQNQPSQDNLIENLTQSGTYQDEDSENRNSNLRKEFPERTRQHDYKTPTANQDENDQEDFDEDELNSDAEAFGQDYENNANYFVTNYLSK